MADERVTAVEIALSHAERTVEELSELVRDHAERIARLERLVGVLLKRAEDGGGAPAADQRPPHW